MSDRFPAQIWIGGKISRAVKLYPDDPDDNTTILQGLIGALADDGASHEYGDRVISDNCTEAELLDEYMNDGATLHLKDDQARNGEFEVTEQFCIENNIPFDRWGDHYSEYDAENVYWRPGMNSVMVRYADANGHEIVCGDTVRKAIDDLDGIMKETNAACLADVMNLLVAACPELPPDLEGFEIIA